MNESKSKTVVVLSTADMPVAPDPFDLNLRTWQAIAEAFDRVHLLAVAPRIRRSTSYAFGRVVVTALPLGVGPHRHLVFALRALGRIVQNRDLRRARVFAATDPLGAGLAAVVAAHWFGGRAIVDLLGQLLTLPKEHRLLRRWVIAFVARAVLRRADIVRVCVERFADDVERAGVPADRIVYVPSRVDPQEFTPPTGPRAEFRSKLGLPRDDFIVGFAAALNTSKGVEVFEEMVEIFPDPAPLFVVAGDGPLRPRVEALAARWDERVRYLGPLHRSRMRDFFCAADVVIQPSRDEGQPRTVLEAMSCCTPIVASNVGGIPEIVQHGRTGLLIPPNDARSLADAIHELRGDAEGRKVLGKAARAFICAHHSFHDGIARLQRLYEQ